MKRARLVLSALLAWVLLLALGEVFPVFTVSFWRLAFASEFVMFAGIDNPYARYDEAKLFLRVYGSRDPEAAFVQLYHVGNQQAKAFALYGLHEAGSPRFEEFAAQFTAEGGYVRQVLTTCSVRKMPATSVVETIRLWQEIVRSSTLPQGPSKEAEPGATDNPDDAQRFREDH